eukprot:2115869-Rhodomonas_salina.1
MAAQAHEAAICSLLVIEETMLASGDDDGVVKLWDLRQQCVCVSSVSSASTIVGICTPTRASRVAPTRISA